MVMNTQIDEITSRSLKEFEANIEKVNDLLNFDDVVIKYALSQVETVRSLVKSEKSFSANKLRNLDKALDQLNGIRDHRSLRGNFDVILNQGLVLQVSYFTSAISEMLEGSFSYMWVQDSLPKGIMEKTKISLRGLKDVERNLSESIGHLIVSARSISVQDMQSINRALEELFSFTLPRDENLNNVVVGQALRHAIVHNGAIVDKGVVSQLKNAKPRTLYQKVSENTPIAVSERSLEVVAKAMLETLASIREGISKSVTQ